MYSLTKPISMADFCFFVSLPSLLTPCSKSSYLLSFPPKPINFFLSSSHSSPSLTLKSKTHFPSLVPFVAHASDWSQQGEENDSTIGINDIEVEERDSKWENDENDGPEASWGLEGEDAIFEEQSGDSEEEVSEPPEEAKLFIGNFPFDVDSQSLAMLFEKAGIVEIAEV
ncbi:chloroplast RNA-binding protein 31B [Hibiscus trionum]|uniref:Chloroplast RNA-binding protein 31B n=1 Tax=Hibiscus trionum TaxID=183268 RepID=A0A9W7LHM6_HIBTR|nr:chloroplast RNA-binding protein 31B [Hibiscus trionum]